MDKYCSCFQCEPHLESNINLELDIGHGLSTLSKSQIKMVGYSQRSSCLSSIFSIRTTRSFKKLCLLTAILTFCIGIGVGVLIPLYLMPKTEILLVESNISEINNSVKNQNNILMRTVEASVIRQTSEVASTMSTSSVLQAENPSENISNRFPEFAQLEALVQDNKYDNNIKTKLPSKRNSNPIFQRPSVQFVSPDSRILSLHPIKQQIPSARTINSTGEKLIYSSEVKTKLNVIEENSLNLVEGIYWSSDVEKTLPPGFTDENVTNWRKLVKESIVERVEEGCGRMQNRLLTLENDIHACCRYRQNSDQIQGEIFSFYLSRLLGLQNLAPSTLALIQLSSKRWKGVRHQLNDAQWSEEKPVVFTQFIKNLSPAYVPKQFRDPKRSLYPIDVILSSHSSLDIAELAQWSDLIIFDYLTANLDRMVNNLYNLQWNPSMMEAPAHNLVKDSSTGLLVFLDNESGLLHGYRLLDKYEQYHRMMLESLCVFRKSTVNAIKRLSREKNVGHLLKEMFYRSEPLLVDYLPMMPDKSIKILQHRIERVFDQIKKCESLYPL